MSNVKPLRYVRNGSDTIGLSELQAGETIAFADIEAHNHEGVYQPADADIPTVSASQAEMEAGTETALRSMSPLRVKQSIDRLSKFQNLKVALSTENWTPPVTGTYRVHVFGAGGSGGAYRAATATIGGATGGGAGGYARKTLTLSSEVAYTLTVGAGGAAVSATADNTGANGNAGGNSSISGSDISTITANGGGAGGQTSSADTLAGASGGAATGGDVNYTGGGSGSVTGVGNKATGGGATALFGTSYASGDANSSSVSFAAATGGAGIGGKSGDATASTVASYSAGGGTAGPSASQSNAVASTSALAFSAYPAPFTGGGTGGQGSVNGAAVNGLVLGGGGGRAGTATSAFLGVAGTGGQAGGGGGGSATQNQNATSGKGGDGVILIEW